jgi:hypothetical protein
MPPGQSIWTSAIFLAAEAVEPHALGVIGGELDEQLELQAAEMDRGAGGGGAAGGEVDVDLAGV